MNRYDEYYRNTPDVFGPDPDEILVEHAGSINPAATVLDIGCGQGRHAFYLARRGLTIDALDPSKQALLAVAETASRENLGIRGIHGSFSDVSLDTGGYGAILVFGLIPDLPREQLRSLVQVIDGWLAPGGLLFITAFGTWDPGFGRHREEWTQAAENSFCSLDGAVRTYLEPGELAALFPGWSVIHSWEGLGPEHRHGDAPVERHGRTEAVLRKNC